MIKLGILGKLYLKEEPTPTENDESLLSQTWFEATWIARVPRFGVHQSFLKPIQ